MPIEQVLNKGRVPVKIWSKDLDSKTLDQLTNISQLPFIYKWVSAMPDAHLGTGATVGTVIATDKAIIPAAIGVDIGCVDSQTEYLTPFGWKKISEYKGEKVLQFNPETNEGEFVNPLAYIKEPYKDDFLLFKTKYGINQALTPDHRCLIYKYDRSYKFNHHFVLRADEIEEKHNNLVLGVRHKIMTVFKSPKRIGLTYTNEILRIIVMICADGSFSNRDKNSKRCTLIFRKQRKIDRASELLSAAGISFKVSDNDIDTIFTFEAPFRIKCLSSLYDANEEQLKIILDEVLKWDGTEKDHIFFSRNKESADFVQYVFTTQGFRSSITTDIRKDDGIDYRVVISANAKVGFAGTPKTPVTRIKGDGFKYCFTVPSSFLIFRREGNIFATGNCGMMAVQTNLTSQDLPESLKDIRMSIERGVPLGSGGHHVLQASHVGMEREGSISRLQTRFKELRGLNPFIEKKEWVLQLGTLGSGNHFIEICLDTSDNVWVMLHSGSRGIGNLIGSHFIAIAKKEMERFMITLPDKDLAYLPEGSDHFNDYVNAVLWSQDFALLNRELMMDEILKNLKYYIPHIKITEKAVNCHHNYVAKEVHYGKSVWLTRKGAIKANAGDLGIIPGSMGTKSYIVKGKGNLESFNSCSHGAGRNLSRKKAKELFTEDNLKEAMKGIEYNHRKNIIDEIPGAYKDIDQVMENQKDLVEPIHTLKQIISIKGD